MKCVSRIDLALMFVFDNIRILINLEQLKNLAFDRDSAIKLHDIKILLHSKWKYDRHLTLTCITSIETDSFLTITAINLVC